MIVIIITAKTVYSKNGVDSQPDSLKKKRALKEKEKKEKEKEPVAEEAQSDRFIHPLSLLRQKYPAACHYLPSEIPSELSIMTMDSASQGASVVSPVSHSVVAARSTSHHSCSRHSIMSSPSTRRARTPSPLRITDQLEELLEGQGDLPTPQKRVHTHTPWVLEPERPRRTRGNVSVSSHICTFISNESCLLCLLYVSHTPDWGKTLATGSKIQRVRLREIPPFCGFMTGYTFTPCGIFYFSCLRHPIEWMNRF